MKIRNIRPYSEEEMKLQLERNEGLKITLFRLLKSEAIEDKKFLFVVFGTDEETVEYFKKTNGRIRFDLGYTFVNYPGKERRDITSTDSSQLIKCTMKIMKRFEPYSKEEIIWQLESTNEGLKVSKFRLFKIVEMEDKKSLLVVFGTDEETVAFFKRTNGQIHFDCGQAFVNYPGKKKIDADNGTPSKDSFEGLVRCTMKILNICQYSEKEMKLQLECNEGLKITKFRLLNTLATEDKKLLLVVFGTDKETVEYFKRTNGHIRFNLGYTCVDYPGKEQPNTTSSRLVRCTMKILKRLTPYSKEEMIWQLESTNDGLKISKFRLFKTVELENKMFLLVVFGTDEETVEFFKRTNGRIQFDCSQAFVNYPGKEKKESSKGLIKCTMRIKKRLTPYSEQEMIRQLESTNKGLKINKFRLFKTVELENKMFLLVIFATDKETVEYFKKTNGRIRFDICQAFVKYPGKEKRLTAVSLKNYVLFQV